MINLAELANKLGVSRTKTKHLIEEITKFTPPEVIIYKNTDSGKLYDFDKIVEWIQKIHLTNQNH